MKKTKIIIITEGSKELGLGHIYSCLSLYQSFRTEKVKAKILVKGDSLVKKLLAKTDFILFDWSDKKNERKLFKISKDATIVIIDSLIASKKIYEKFSKTTKVPVFIDYNKRLNYPRGVIINRTLDAHKLDYPNKKNIIYLLGTRYFPLTKAFWYAPEKKINTKVNSILITFGGSDPKEMTPLVLKYLADKYKSFKKYVIIGKAFENIKVIKKFMDKNTKLFFHPRGEMIKNIMLKSDIAISAGGQTLFELARIGVPTIAVAVANNQKYNIKSLSDVNFIENAGNWNDKNFYQRLNYLINKLKDIHLRKRKSIIGRTLIDGYGCVRITNFLLGLSQKI